MRSFQNLRRSFALLTFLTTCLSVAVPALACLLADRLRVIAPHLTEKEIELYAHGNMIHQKIPYQLAAATSCVNGLADIFPCDQVDLLGHLNLSEIGGGGGNDLWGWEDPVTGTEYALIGRTNGTAFIDISDPTNPIFVGNLPSHSGSSSWRDIKTFADHAFVVADRQPHGIQVFDLSQLRNVTNPPVTFGETAHYDLIEDAHNIVINEDTGFAYAVGSNTCSGGLYMVDINNPTSPTFAGCYAGDGYTHDAQCVTYSGPDTQHLGREICFASNEDTLTIVDVTNKSNPVQLSRTGYVPQGTRQYAHQGWLTEDQQYFVFDDEFDELGATHNTRTYVWDVSDIDAPVVTGFWDAAGSSVDHNQYVHENFTFQANYSRGLRILELTNPATANLTEVGFFDTHPEVDGNSFNGAWSTYPFFDSGVILVSDINRGLFILRRQTGGGNSPPAVTITTPSTGSSFPEASSIAFGGTANDTEDGDLSGNLSWVSSLDGNIGSGASFSAVLSLGTHVVTASVTDAGGSPGSASVTITVSSAPTGCAAEVSFESGAAGWTNSGASTCTTGTLVVGAPTEVVSSGITTQVGGDHTTGSGNAFFTAPNTSAGVEDVDGGTCIAESPTYGIFEASDISLWYFHGQRDGADDAGDFFTLEMSTDNGATYSSLASIGDVATNAAWTRVTASAQAGDQVRFRLSVADGSGGGDLIEAGLDDLTICPSGGGGNTAPSVDITSPAEGSTAESGANVAFAGSATDAEDGTISGSLSWSSSRDGIIGSGASFSTSALSVGAHVVTASVTDSGGLSANAQVSITIVNPPTGGCLHEADFESGAGGWAAGADTCSTGTFILGVPDATAWQVGGGNPGSAFFTATNPGGIGSNDVDGGTCEALSPVIDASGESAVDISLDFFHGQRDGGDDAGDGFVIEVLNNGSVVQTLANIGDVTTNPAWTSASVNVSNPGNLQVRVRATDATGGGDIIEGGIDNVRICPGTAPPACSVEESFEGGIAGWTNSTASTCATGRFILDTPTEVVTGGVTTQPDGDHTSGSGNAIFTAVNTAAGTDDVDAGTCILTSPVYSITEPSNLSAWIFHGQRDAGDDSGDLFLFEVSLDGGSTWSTLESFGDETVNAVWSQATGTAEAGDQVQFRIQVADGTGGGDLIEAGIDDVSICPR